MIAKRSRTVFPSKVDVQSESDQIASKGELEQPLPSSTQEVKQFCFSVNYLIIYLFLVQA